MNIGIVGTGFIADVVARAIAESESVALVGVASRRAETARAFAQRHSEPTVFEHWSDLLASPGVDAVYVATPTAVREAICVAAASEGKHVLAEKPFVDLGSLRTITEACRQNGVAFMDATHFTHHPRTQLLRRDFAGHVDAAVAGAEGAFGHEKRGAGVAQFGRLDDEIGPAGLRQRAARGVN